MPYPTSAEISIDFRLVPDQTPASVQATVEHFLTAHGWTLVSGEPDLATRSSIRPPHQARLGAGYPAIALRHVLARRQGGDRRRDQGSRRARRGGAHDGRQRAAVLCSPKLSRAPIIGVPIVNHDNNQHAANENLRLQNLWDGINTYAALMAELNW